MHKAHHRANAVKVGTRLAKSGVIASKRQAAEERAASVCDFFTV